MVGKCEADFYVDRKIQLRAVPDEGFVFTGWSGGACTKKSKTCTLVIKNDYSVTAHLSRNKKLESSKWFRGIGDYISEPLNKDSLTHFNENL